MPTAQELAGKLRDRFRDLIAPTSEFRGEHTLTVHDPERIAGIDNYGTDPRWTVGYELAGFGHGCHLRLRTSVGEEKSELPTVSGVWKTANWHEREAYDLLGIRFRGHPDLRRILLPEDWQGHALRKDFPLRGYEPYSLK